MQIVSTINELKILRNNIKESVGFVATMGCLHDGHASLIKRSKKENETTLLSIFVNPTQFNNKDDLKNYPKTRDADVTLAKQLGVDIVFIPDGDAMYPDHYHFKLSTCDPLAAKFEGEFRPGHYDGVLSIVMKLLNLTKPHNAYFGEKDFQQYVLIKRMVESFFMDINIIMCHTVREPSGLAMSSRNTRLNAEQKQRAELFAKTLQAEKDIETLKNKLIAANIKIDYVEHFENRLLAAVCIDDIRLIDTIEK